jgi:CDGSH-type Zn-finger protein
VLRPLAVTLGPGDGLHRVQQEAAPADLAQLAREAARFATELRAGLADAAPPVLIEATAALQQLACELAPTGQRASRIAELAGLMTDLPAQVMVAENGPYLATNIPAVRTHLGEQLPVPPQLALCRCGQSAMKPFCDGAHARTGFTGDKDPNRVPDRRDIYQGQQVRVFDNRGICQHSGLCTDRLPAVFRTDAEPFVAPSGGRLDEIIRAVRDCPSGALSLALDGEEARLLVDWNGERQPVIEVSLHGPYRVTGGIPLAADEARLPADPAFRAALAGYLDWGSRIAQAESAIAAQQGAAAGESVPNWDWPAAGPPVVDRAEAAEPGPPTDALPEPGAAVSFDAHVKQLFRPADRNSMTFAFDLWSRADVQVHAAAILDRLASGTRP